MIKTFRILSLSGGGVRGIFQAAFLRELEKKAGVGLSDWFDLVAGTSTGSIVGMSIALGLSMDRVLQLYRDKARSIFQSRFLGSVRRGTRYPQEPLRESLKEVFGDKKLGDARPLIVTASGLDRFQHRVFSNIREISDGDATLSAVEVVLASAAAPTYFPPVKPETQERSYVDGGLWANSPALLAVLAAHCYLGVPLENIRLLSIGTGYFPDGRTLNEALRLRPFSIGAVTTVFELMWGAQASFVDQYARTLLTDEHFIKADVPLNKSLALDDVETALSTLPALAEKECHDTVQHILRMFDVGAPGVSGQAPSSANRPRSDLTSLAAAGLIAAFPTRSITIRSEYDRRMEAARTQADVIGFGLSSLREDHLGDFGRWKVHVPIRVLLIDPDFPTPEFSYAAERDKEERNPEETIRNQVLQFVSDVQDLLDNRFQIRLYRCLPLLNLFRIDDEVLWGPFLIGEQSRNTPTFISRQGGFVFSHLTSHFDSIWNSRDLSRAVPAEWLSK